jgi:putative nucleotidyltransferase with HDIG domain
MVIVNNPDATVEQVEAIVEADPGLAGNLLRSANSAYFGFRGEIATVKDAIVRIGMKRIAQLALTSAIAPLARVPLRGYDMPPKGLLRHSTAVAIAVEEVAASTRRKPPEWAFTAGLLHDVGKIVLGSFLEVDAAPIFDLAHKEHLSFERAEREVLGIDHAEVGAALLSNWGLPTYLIETVRYHHCPDDYPGGDRLVVDLVHVADHLARSTGTASGLDGMHYSLCNRSVEELRVSAPGADAVISNVFSLSGELCTALT